MRLAFVQTLIKLAEKDKNVWLVTGDLGFSVFEGFKERFPEQYLNVGVAEQNLIGTAAGLALAGKRPFVYSITTFATMRPYEQIRNDVCYQNLPVVIIGGGSTFSYSTFGCTHMPFEDFALMRVLPHMAVLSPGDPLEVRELIHRAYERGGPAYMRIAKKGEPAVHQKGVSIELGKSVEVRAGTDASIIVTGRQLPSALAAAELLQKKGVNVRVLSMHTIKPLDEEAIVRAAEETGAMVTCEEHSIIGGLGSAVAEVLMRRGVALPFATIGVTDEFPNGVGSQDFFLKQYGLTPEGIAERVRSIYARK
jgi:transketolase